MKHILRMMILALTLLAPAQLAAREDRLAQLLEQCLLREKNSPDSIEDNLQLLEQELAKSTGVRRAVVGGALARLYAMRAHTDVTGRWRQRSIELFRESLADPALLYNARTKDWLPIVSRGKDEKIYGGNMLYVVWQAASQWAADSVMSERELIEFYASQGNKRPSQVLAESERLCSANDSIWKVAPRLKVEMAEVYYPGDSLAMTVDSFNVSQLVWKVTDSRGKLVGRNMLVAPSEPGRYTVEIKCRTDVRMQSKPKPLKIGFVVSRLQMFVMDMPAKQLRVTAVDARSGQPRPEAQVLRDRSKQTVRVVLGADSCLPEIRYYERYNYNAPPAKTQPRVAIYTDRAVYRPGQTIHLSAILYSVRHWEASVRSPRECRVQLLDDRSAKVLSDTIVSVDTFGTASATLSIPKDVTLGNLLVNVDGTRHNVRVEEYKRPTFYVAMDEKDMDVTIHPLESEGSNDEVAPTDSIITISGLAANYDGTPLRGGRVTATSRRINCWWWRRTPGEVRQLDTVYTDLQGRFVLQVPVSRDPLHRYAPVQRVDVEVLSPQGETHTASTVLRLFADLPQPVQEPKTKEWLECPQDTFDSATPALLEFRGEHGQERCIFLTAFAGDKVAIDTILYLTDSLHLMHIPYKEDYADGLLLKAVYVRDGRVYSKDLRLCRRLPDTSLHLHWDTFRDHTQPGAVEQWTLRILDSKGSPADANVMMTVYDASLDAFAPNRWNFSHSLHHRLAYSQTRTFDWFSKQWQSAWMDFQVWTHKIPHYSYSTYDNRYFVWRGHGDYAAGATVDYFMLGKRAGSVRASRQYSAAVRNTFSDEEAEWLGSSPESGGEEEAFDAVELRSDFTETAMFMPQLRTDTAGRVSVSFSVPHSLTTWQVMALAHTRHMHTGTLERQVVARKALSCKLHLPRFVREKDHMSFAVQLSNTSPSAQQGRAQVQVMDAQSGKVLLRKTIPFALGQSADTTLMLSMDVPKGLEGLRVKAVALARKDSDGEQRELPVLSSVVQMTQSRALTLAPGESRTIDLRTLFPEGAAGRQVVLQRVTDPVQVAIDALPSVALPTSADVLSYASAYYAASKLHLPDTTFYINKVYTMQKPDGSMPWFDGLAGNAYLTREVGYLLARLNSANPNARKVMDGIRRYLKTALEESIERRREYNKDWQAQLADLRTLYVLTKDGQADKESLQLVKKVLKHLPDNMDEMDSEYIAIAMIVKHAMNEAVLKDAVAVLKSRLTHKDGTYLAYRGGSWPSIDRRLHIHTQVMEAWQTVFPFDTTTIQGMQSWLLDQKRTQGWKSPIECIDAVYALTGGTFPTGGNEDGVTKCDTIDPVRQRSVTIKNDGDAVMWAGVFAQYSVSQDQVQSSSMDISLQRTFSPAKPKVGDRVREEILIHATRDYEFLVLSVPRASCAEPVAKLSGCGWQKGVSYYVQVHDDRTEYFIPSLPHGKYILQTEYTIQRQGQYSTGIPTIRCCYAPEFRANAVDNGLTVKE